MPTIRRDDLRALQAGQPPTDPALLQAMTVGRELWLDYLRVYYLENYIADGGSKVKVLVGNRGAGKTHLLKVVAADAKALGYETVSLSARSTTAKLSDLPSLYRDIAREIDMEFLVAGLCRRVATELGYDERQYDGYSPLLPLLVEKGRPTPIAKREIGDAAWRVFRRFDLGPSFLTFVWGVVQSRTYDEDEEDRIREFLYLKWLAGEKLERGEKQQTSLFERLEKPTARYWLNSLIHLLRIAGKRGLLVQIDDLEALTERSGEDGGYRYSPQAVKDSCELFRQLIDDADCLSGFFLLLAGRPPFILDLRRGFQSYEALWMRLQTGLVPSTCFNPYADMINVDAHNQALSGGSLAEQVAGRLRAALAEAGLRRGEQPIPRVEELAEEPLRAGVRSEASLYQEERS